MTGYRLAVDRIACDGHGSCAQLLPDRITLDEWGFPLLAPDPLPRERLRDAKLAADLCPRLALRLTAVAPARS